MRTDWDNLRAPLQQALDAATASGQEHSCQLAIYHRGKLAISLCSGPGVTRKSLFPVFSCSKPVAATVVARLVQKGLLDYDMPVRELWPEFACNGKEETRLWHFLSHRAGLSALPKLENFDEQADWRRMCELLAAAIPGTPVGGRHVYHGVTFAWLVGEMVQRATGKSFMDVVREELLEPLKLEGDLMYGSTDEAEKRFVPVDGSAFAKPDWCSQFMNNPVIRRACIPSANALMTAEALARHYAALTGEVDGVRLLKPEVLARATTLCRSEDDPIQDPPEWDKFGMGYALMGPAGDLGNIFGQGGACGSEGFGIKSEQIGMAFTKNKSLPCHPNHQIRNTISDILGLEHRIW